MAARFVPTDIQGARRQRPFPLDQLSFSDHMASRIRLIARAWGALATIGFMVMGLRGGIPQSPARDDWELYAQLALLILVAIGGLLTWRWEGAGASLIVLGAVGLGALAALEHHPWRALLVAVVFYVPALLFWLVWQRTKPVWEIGVLVGALALSLLVGGYMANRTYATYFGPVQPESALTAQPVTLVEWIWAGGTTDDSIEVRASIANQDVPVRLALSTNPEMTTPRYVQPDPAADQTGDGVVGFAVAELAADTEYWYAVEGGGQLDLSRQGHFRTFPRGPGSFTFAFGSCADTGSNGAVFDTIRETDPLFFLAAGDFYYENIAVNDPLLYRAAFDRNLMAPAQDALYRIAPIAYVWDDHDYGPNNSNGTSPSRDAAEFAYRELVPHYPLMTSDPVSPIFQAFTVGRVRFILTDNYTHRSPDDAVDDASKTMLGEDQKSWLMEELRTASDRYGAIVWVNSQPWISEAAPGAAGWGSYATERQELANFIAEQDIDNLVMLSGDAHMLAIDDGSNSDYATGGGGGFPVFHAAALDRHGSSKGGPYSEGQHPGGGQFGVMSVRDDGGASVEIDWSGRNWKNEEIVGYRFTLPATKAVSEGTRAPDADPTRQAYIPIAAAPDPSGGRKRMKS